MTPQEIGALSKNEKKRKLATLFCIGKIIQQPQRKKISAQLRHKLPLSNWTGKIPKNDTYKEIRAWSRRGSQDEGFISLLSYKKDSGIGSHVFRWEIKMAMIVQT